MRGQDHGFHGSFQSSGFLGAARPAGLAMTLALVSWAAALLSPSHRAEASATSPLDAYTCDIAPVIGHVVKVKNGRVYVSAGTAGGIEPGMHVGVIPCGSIPYSEELGHGVVCEDNKEITAIVEIDKVDGKGASGILGRGAAAKKGDVVLLVDREPPSPRRYQGFPMQYLNIWDVSLGIRVLPGIGEGGALVSGDLLLSYQFPIPVKLTAVLTPIQLAAQDGTFATTSAGFMASISTRFFEAGFGIGVNAQSEGDTGDAVLFQFVRLGAENGLMVKLLNTFLHGGDDGDGGFALESMQWEMRIPLVSKVSLLFQWGGGGMAGAAEWFRITLGAMLMLRGTGGPGTISVPIGIGGGFYDYWGPCNDWDCSDKAFVGPVISTGLEARF